MQASRRLNHTIFYAGLFLFAFIYIASGILRIPDIYDEGLIAVGAWRVLHGEFPLRDFWTIYPPGQFFIIAAVFKLFGTTLITLRLWDCAIRALLVVVITKLGFRISASPLGLLPAFLTLIWVERFGSYGYPIFTALLLVLVSLYLATSSDSTRIGRSILAGICLGSCCLIRLDIAAYGFCAILPALAWGARSHSITIVVTTAVMAICHLLLLLFLVPLERAFYLLIFTPLTVFPSVRAIPFPDPITILSSGHPDLENKVLLSVILLYSPWLICGLSVFYYRKCKDRLPQPLDRALFVGLTVLFLTLFNQARIRSDMFHMFPLFIPTWLSWILLVSMVRQGLTDPRQRRFITNLLLMPLVAFAVIPLQSKVLSALNRSSRVEATQHTIQRAEFLPVPQETQQVVTELTSTTQPEDRIFIGLTSYDHIDRNDIMLYFLSGRLPTGYYHELHPGVADQHIVQNAIRSDIHSDSVKTVVLLKNRASAALHSSYALTELTDSLFDIKAETAHYLVLGRNNRPEPQH